MSGMEPAVSPDPGEALPVAPERPPATTFAAVDLGSNNCRLLVARPTGGSIDVQESELNGAAWFHDLPADLHWSVEGHPWSWAEW